MSITTIGAGSDRLSIGISEDYYNGDAQYTISLDGQQVDGVLTANSLHRSFTADTVNVLADLAPGIHTVTVNFLNDAYGGAMDSDRNLYIDGLVYDGTFVPQVARELQVSGPSTIGFLDSTVVPATNGPTTTTIGSGPDTLVLNVSQDAYQGNAQYAVAIDGQQVDGILTATALHGSGTPDTVNVLANLAGGPHTVTLSFLNDLYDGTSATDRNLYLDNASYNGAAVGGVAQTLFSTESVDFGITDADAATSPPTPPAGSSLVVSGGETVAAQGDQLANVRVLLQGTAGTGTAANLTLDDASVGSLVVANTDPSGNYSAYSGHLDAFGQSAVNGSVTIGSTRPFPPGYLDATVHGSDGVLALHGVTVAGASNLTVNGDAGSTVENDGTISIGGGYITGSVNIQTNLQGTGTLLGSADVTNSPASFRLGGEVGAGQTVDLTDVRLQLDQPMRFEGTLTGFNDGHGLSGAAAPRVSGGTVPSRIVLANETVTGTSFEPSATGVGDLRVFTQDQGTGAVGETLDLHVAGSFAADAFAFNNNASTHAATIYLSTATPGLVG